MTSMREQLPPFVSHIRVRGFRSLAECDVRLGPLTVLAGFNASGKSNFLDALRFVRDALAYSPGQAIAKRGGLESVLRRIGTAGESGGSEIAGSFLIALELSLQPDAGRATYELCIGRDPQEEFTHLVLRENCTLQLPGDDVSFSTDLTSERRRDVKGWLSGALLDPGELLLPTAGRLAPYDRLLHALLAMRFYELETDVLRGLDDTRLRQTQLGERGEHLGQVLGLLAAQHPSSKESLDGFMRWLIPSLLGVDQRLQGDYATIQARFWTGDPVLAFWDAVNAGAVHAGDPHVEVFQSEQLSKGTVRGMGVLAALFQPDALTGAIPLVAIEEPEIAIHPARVAGLFDAIKETSLRTQVIVTTRSSDLLDSEVITPAHLRIVEMARGVTIVGELDAPTQRYLTEHLSDLPEMHRQGHLRPTHEYLITGKR